MKIPYILTTLVPDLTLCIACNLHIAMLLHDARFLCKCMKIASIEQVAR